MINLFVKQFPLINQDTLNQIKDYYSYLQKWNHSHNLVQKNTLDPLVFEQRHLIDCWQLVELLNRDLPIVDIGSGAGLPGILLSIAGFTVELIERDLNKVAFLKMCAVHLGLNYTVNPNNAYNLNVPCRQTTSRAFSSLNDLLTIQYNAGTNATGFYLKGVTIQGEIEVAYQNWLFNYELKDSYSSPEGKIIIVRNLKKSKNK